MFDAMALHPVFVFDHSAQLPDAVALPLYLTKGEKRNERRGERPRGLLMRCFPLRDPVRCYYLQLHFWYLTSSDEKVEECPMSLSIIHFLLAFP